MAASLAADLAHAIPGLQFGATAPGGGNRLAVEGLAMRAAEDGALEIRADKLTASALRLASGPLVLEVGAATLHGLLARVRMEGATPHLLSLQAARAELADAKLEAPLTAHGGPAQAQAASAGPWSLAPLATAEGVIRAQIVDAHLLFDADVAVPIKQGQIEFRDATVEHVGPDSRMGVSRLGLYVDAPNGRSYLYQFSAAPVGGVEYEQRGALLGPWVKDRGRLRLQPFGESLLRQPAAGRALGFTEQARQLFDRTSASGYLQLGDGLFAAPGVQAEFTGRAAQRNLLRLHSEAVGRGLTVELAALSLRQVQLGTGTRRLLCKAVTGAVTLRVAVEHGNLRAVLELAKAELEGLEFQMSARL